MGHTVCDSKLTSAGLLAEGDGERDSRSGFSFLFIAAPGFRFDRDRNLRRLRFPLVNENLNRNKPLCA